jgi:hypothetical protein
MFSRKKGKMEYVPEIGFLSFTLPKKKLSPSNEDKRTVRQIRSRSEEEDNFGETKKIKGIRKKEGEKRSKSMTSDRKLKSDF